MSSATPAVPKPVGGFTLAPAAAAPEKAGPTVLEPSVRWRAEVRELDGDPLVLMWATPADGSGPEAVEYVLRAATADGGITRLRWYYFCPDVLTEVGHRLDVPVRTRGHIV